VRGPFPLCRIPEGALAYPDFERVLAVFVRAVRYWKKWLALPPETASSVPFSQPPDLFALKV
jgi:hypothetical protein